jgi:Lrp/AsnC family transcriptional regulator, leucine-responsive regulatory protein
MTLDAQDRRLLRALQVNTNQTHAELGRRAHMSASSVRRRLKVLRRNRTIRSEVALLDPAVLGAGITVLTLVSFKKENPRIHTDFEQRIRADPEVLQIHVLGGEIDFALLVHAPDPASYEEWGRRVLLTDVNLARYSSFIVWTTMKHNPQPLISLDEAPAPVRRRARNVA